MSNEAIIQNTQKARPKGRNQSIECCRLIASLMVVFIHYLFPGTLGELMNCLARFAVPFFFVVSGFYVYQADANTIRRRLYGVVKLNIIATLIYLVWEGYKVRVIANMSVRLWLLGAFSNYNLSLWFINSINPFQGHLWYLTAVMVCYIILLVYVQWWKESEKIRYQPLYIVGVGLLIAHFLMGSAATAMGFHIPFQVYRNALFFGLPMFVTGLFLGEYHKKIIEIYCLTKKKLVAIIAAGAIISVVQWLGTGAVEMPAGTFFEVIALVLLVLRIPELPVKSGVVNRLISKFGKLSTYIYVTHLFWADIYFFYGKRFLLLFGENAEHYLYPAAIAMLSLATGLVWVFLSDAVKRCLRK